MNCVDVMYQLYPSYFPHKSSEPPKFGSSVGPYDHGYGGSVGSSGSLGERDMDIEADDIENQPKASQYVNANCVLLNYFTGDTATVVDEHFTRALSQPSSFSVDRSMNNNNSRKSEKPLMCQRKLPPSFWNSAYRPSVPSSGLSAAAAAGSSLDYARDSYFSPSWYPFQNNWPYRLPSHGHSDIGQSLTYSGIESSGKLNNPYQSFMFPGGYDRGSSKFEFSKNMDSLTGSSSYYGLPRLGMEFPSKSNLDSGVSGLEYQLQSAARRELCW